MALAAAGSIPAALEHAARLLNADPVLAERQAREILQVAPRDPRAILILGAAQRRQGDAAAARAVLAPLSEAQPGSAHTHYELGMALADLGERDASIAALRHAVSVQRTLPDAWRALGDQLFAKGDEAGADGAYAEQIRASVRDPALLAAADALLDDRIAVAERLLRDHLRAKPTDVAAMRLLAEAGTRLGRYGDAEQLLLRCLELAPGFDGARYNLAIVLYRQQKAARAIPHIERLLVSEPRSGAYRNLLAACLALIGDYDRAIGLYGALLAEQPDQAKVWLSHGHVLKTAGRRADAMEAYRRAIALAPGLGDAYWSLANLKTEPFSAGEETAMTAQLASADLSNDDRLHLHFALGKALEDRGDAAAAFAHYQAGAALRRAELAYDAKEATAQTERSKALFTSAFFADRAGAGSPSAAPIFILGLPRSGSTLIEQILASHSAVEGTMELPEIVAAARDLTLAARKTGGPPYPDLLADVAPAALATLGESFLEQTKVYRRLGRAHFIDKMPNNLHHIGLILLILPNARIIDARRHPMAACFSAFKQHFARGQAFSYDLADLGRYYRDYVGLMAHFDEVLPGRIHRVIYEDLVEDTEGEVRRLLDYCGLAFEPACLKFYENDRAVRTASSEQVRRPIFREGLDQWRQFEPWLDPLKAALGGTLADWRG
jgi:tetratricopeptide (TPR) repeat protein